MEEGAYDNDSFYYDDSPNGLLEADGPREDWATEQIKLVSRIFMALAGIIGIPGNVFVLISIYTFREMRTISNMYIFNLALADLIFLMGTPLVIAYQISKTWQFGYVTCRIFLSANGISQFASALFIGVLSFDRYLAVCRPVQATEWRNFRAAIAISSLAWIIIVAEMSPLIYFSQLLKYQSGDEVCMFFTGSELTAGQNETVYVNLDPQEQQKLMEKMVAVDKEMVFSNRFFTTYTFLLSYLLPLLCVWFFYVNIIRAMWARRKHIWGRKKSVKRTTHRVSILGLAIVISYTLCWLPFWFVTVSLATETLLIHPHLYQLKVRIFHIAFALQYINSAANPFLYVFMSDSFRRNVLQLLRSTSAYQYRYRKPRSGTAALDTEATVVFIPTPRDTDTSNNE